MIEFSSEKRLSLECVVMYFCNLLHKQKKDVITVEDFINGCNKRIRYNIDSFDDQVIIRNENNDYCYINSDGIYSESNIFKNTNYGWSRKDFDNIFINNIVIDLDIIKYNEPIEINVENVDENTEVITKKWKSGFEHHNYWYFRIPEPKEL